MQRIQDSNFREARRFPNLALKIKPRERVKAPRKLMKNELASLAICRKRKGLAPNNQNFSKLYLIQMKEVSLNCGSRGEETQGEKMKDSLAMLLKTNIEKMSENRYLAMLMKLNKLKSLSGDVDENRWCYSQQR